MKTNEIRFFFKTKKKLKCYTAIYGCTIRKIIYSNIHNYHYFYHLDKVLSFSLLLQRKFSEKLSTNRMHVIS